MGVYHDGNLHFDTIPFESLKRTWRYTGSLSDQDIEYGWFRCGGKDIEEVCPAHLSESWEKINRRMRAFKKSFEIAKINFRDHCFFDLVPHDFLVEFLEIKNQITKHVFENETPAANEEHLRNLEQLLHKIKYQSMKVNSSDCKELFYSSSTRTAAKKILNGPDYINYNLFGTVTGRLSTGSRSFPILTMKRELRKLIKPQNDWFLSLDYNGAEIRTLLSLCGEPQPSYDIHQWNIDNILTDRKVDRGEAKTIFFAWLYNPESQAITTPFYDRKRVLEKYYDGAHVSTIFGRTIEVDKRRAFNYVIQSTTADLVTDRAIAVDEFLKDKKSFISHIVHDEVVIDLVDEERSLVPQIRDIFQNNKIGNFLVNVSAGKNYFEMEKLEI